MVKNKKKSQKTKNKTPTAKLKKESGFTVSELIIILVVFLILGLFGTKIYQSNHKSGKVTNLVQAQKDDPLPLKSIGFNLDYYNPQTNRAGDMEFTNVDHILSGHNHQIWQDFGTQDYRSPNDPTKKNPQPTYVLPLHTKVQSLVSGEVVDVKQLYSNDYTIWVSGFVNSHYIYETEHVENPLVKKGDRVNGGQIIAEVSSKDSEITPGFGLLEIGILYTAHNYPQHFCPFQYLDKSIKSDMDKKITALHSSWEAYYGQKAYTQNFITPGCVSYDPVNG